MKQDSEILRSYVNDMLTVEKHTLQSIEKQVNDRRMKLHNEAYDSILKIERVLRTHVTTLEQYLATSAELSQAGGESMLKKAAATAAGALAGIYGTIRPEDPVSRNLRDDYTALSLAAISYTMLHTSSLALNNSRIADMALEHLNDLTPLIAGLSRVIPLVVARELADQGKAFDAQVSQEALDKTQKAWSRENIG
jgi:hypothetical protein